MMASENGQFAFEATEADGYGGACRKPIDILHVSLTCYMSL